MRVHSKEKPFCCIFPGCYAKFSQSSHLNTHKKIHEKQTKSNKFKKKLYNYFNYLSNNKYIGTFNINNIERLKLLTEKGINLNEKIN